MSDIPGHISPNYSAEIQEDALFHYTTAAGLVGIFESNEMWGTAYYCANDEKELSAGSGVLSPIFRKRSHELIQEKDARVEKFYRRGVDVRDYADGFERQITSLTLSALCAYITCFCKPTGKEDFHHGLLSQWRGYGSDGGYALQFSRQRLKDAIARANKNGDSNFDLEDIHYTLDNPLRAAVLEHTNSFLDEYEQYLNELAMPIDSKRTTMRNPVAGLLNGPLVALLDYLSNTKDRHFAEERECRLSLIQPTSIVPGARPVKRFSRNGLIVSYTTTPKETFNILACVDWIIVGPGPRIGARFKAANELVKHSQLDIKVRPSHIPFTRA